MPVTNPFSITFGGLLLGGGSDYQLLGPYVVDKTYEQFRIVFDVIVVAGTFPQLYSWSNDLEDAFRSRPVDGSTFKISIDADDIEYTVGTDILNVTTSIVKSGNPDTDVGTSRAYTCTIQGELPADATTDVGLRDVGVNVHTDSAGIRTVTFRGVYTATSAGDAKARYEAAFDAVAVNYLDKVDSSATWELVDENYGIDRHGATSDPSPHTCPFERQYIELIADQSLLGRDDDEIKDHRISFSDRSTFPGDSLDDVNRLRRVEGKFECSIVQSETTDLRGVFTEKVRPMILQLFEVEFQPQVFAVEGLFAAFDKTANRLAGSFTIAYQAPGDSNVLEAGISLTNIEDRTIDYTPTHGANELWMEADVGWTTKQRQWTRTLLLRGDVTIGNRLLTAGAGDGGSLPLFSNTVGGQSGPGTRSGGINASGWNIISRRSQVTPQFIGEPGEDQMQQTIFTEVAVEQYHEKPQGTTGSAGNNPIP